MKIWMKKTRDDVFILFETWEEDFKVYRYYEFSACDLLARFSSTHNRKRCPISFRRVCLLCSGSVYFADGYSEIPDTFKEEDVILIEGKRIYLNKAND